MMITSVAVPAFVNRKKVEVALLLLQHGNLFIRTMSTIDAHSTAATTHSTDSNNAKSTFTNASRMNKRMRQQCSHHMFVDNVEKQD